MLREYEETSLVAKRRFIMMEVYFLGALIYFIAMLFSGSGFSNKRYMCIDSTGGFIGSFLMAYVFCWFWPILAFLLLRDFQRERAYKKIKGTKDDPFLCTVIDKDGSETRMSLDDVMKS